MSVNILKMRNLVTSFNTSEGKVVAVNGVDIDIEEGKVLGVVGESGCGKSVTSLSIMKLLPKENGFIEEGSIEFNGQDIVTLSEYEMQSIRGNDIAMIFQEPMTALNPVLRIGEQIGETLDIHQNIKLKSSENKERCIELLNLVGIPRAEQIINEYPHQLSGGMRQRVMIAMALSCKPKLLIADEPTTALDVTIQAQVLDLIRQLKDQLDMSIMFITHDLGVIAEMADKVVVMYAGKIVEKADTYNLFTNPQHPYTKGLLASRPDTLSRSEKLRCIKGMVPSPLNMPKGCAFAPRCDYCQDKCLVEMPELKNYKKNHSVRCWLMDQGGLGNE
ncbi:ABC transporter ATP-binding protein [Clostridium sp. 'deep sea']|uniref:ABC transporter ATP-binding protein n=1 Tax=Clostridium sp. 'deep sea' TaxID=2779445 RepID=UPI00189661A3|nr:ABC transporter ATP-binding protein [Clostridium sp. 'deep sea']QOR34056.1 ABC transporter ATP-binding protein [Clostridium sp. 'deep sea']